MSNADGEGLGAIFLNKANLSFKETVPDGCDEAMRNVLRILLCNLESSADIDVRNYAKYILREGTIFEKRELLICLRSKITMAKKEVKIA